MQGAKLTTRANLGFSALWVGGDRGSNRQPQGKRNNLPSPWTMAAPPIKDTDNDRNNVMSELFFTCSFVLKAFYTITHFSHNKWTNFSIMTNTTQMFSPSFSIPQGPTCVGWIFQSPWKRKTTGPLRLLFTVALLSGAFKPQLCDFCFSAFTVISLWLTASSEMDRFQVHLGKRE